MTIMTITVYAELASEVSKKLNRMAKKAAAYEIPFSYTVGEEHPHTVNVLALRDCQIGSSPTTVQEKVNSYVVAAVDIEVECDSFIKGNGWTVCAKVEHGENGNIVTSFGDCEIKPEWYTLPPKCDHCHTNRFRSVTYICKHDDGSIRQVGRKCLKDYTGINPAAAAMWAEVRDIVEQGMNCTRNERESGIHIPMYSVVNILAHACDVVNEFGYRKSDEPNSTRAAVTELVLSCKQPSADGMKKAVLVRDWLVNLNQIAHDEDAAISAAWEKANETNEDQDKRAAWNLERNRIGGAERNCIPLALSGYAKQSHIGRLSYMPLAYERYLEHKAREERRQEAGARSQHIGDVKQRITIEAETVSLLLSWDGDYGTTWLYKFVDSSGNIYIWYASHKCDMVDGAKIKATVKAHNERDGVKQTIVTRCKVLA